MADVVERVRTWRSSSVLDVRRILSPLRRGAGDPAFVVDGSSLWRTTRMSTGPATVLLRQRDAHTVEARAWGPGASEHLDGLPTLFAEDVDHDVPLAHPVVADARRRHPGLRIMRTERVVEALVPAVIEQKVIGADAFASWRRLLRAHGDAAPGPAPAGMRVCPTAEVWAALPSWEWHLAGVDPARYRAGQAVMRLGTTSLERLTTMPPPRAYAALSSVRGIGRWTSAEVGGRAFGDTDAVPFGDYHLGRTVGTALLGRILDDDDEIAAALEPFRPHRFLALRLMLLSPHVRVERHGPRMTRVDHRRI